MADTRRLNSKPQDLTDAYGPPSNFLEIDIFNPQTVGVGRARYTSYELRMRVREGGWGAQRAEQRGVRGVAFLPWQEEVGWRAPLDVLPRWKQHHAARKLSQQGDCLLNRLSTFGDFLKRVVPKRYCLPNRLK